MSQHNGLMYIFKNGKSEHTWAILKLTIFNSALSLIPIWVGLLFSRIGLTGPTVNGLAEEGEFALYTAALLGPVFYQVLKDFKNNGFPYRHGFAGLTMLLILLATTIYLVRLGVPALEKKQIVGISIVLYVTSQILALFVGYVDMVLENLDYEANAQRAVTNLSRAMDQEGV